MKKEIVDASRLIYSLVLPVTAFTYQKANPTKSNFCPNFCLFLDRDFLRMNMSGGLVSSQLSLLMLLDYLRLMEQVQLILAGYGSSRCLCDGFSFFAFFGEVG